MSMMQEMLADMLKNALPAEIRDLLTPEKIQEFGDKANAFITDLRDSQSRIESKLDTLLLEKGLDNGRSNDSGKLTGSCNGDTGSDISN